MVPKLRVHDPSRLSFRRALRAAVVVPCVFACYDLVVDDVAAATFAAFGSFALLVFSDFGGHRRWRAIAYVTTTLVGGLLVAAGTALSESVGWAAVVALVVVFAIRFTGVLGGMVQAAAMTLTLAYVLAAAIAAPGDVMWSRLGGWLGGGGAATVAALVLWPHYERPRVQRRAASVCRAFAAAVADGPRAPDPEPRLERLRVEYATTPSRPAGASSADRAFVRLIDELIRLGGYLPVEHPGEQDPSVHAALRQATAALEAAADRLDGGTSVPDLVALERARLVQRDDAAASAAGALRRGVSPVVVLGALDRSFRLQIVSFTTLSVAANVSMLTGAQIPPPDAFEIPPDAATRSGFDTVRSSTMLLRTHLARSSPRLHDAVRGAVAVALAVVVAGLAHVGHEFWVVLGTLSVLRSNALGTGRSALQAIVGTSAGFVVASVLMLAVGSQRSALWVALPITAFLSAYTPTAVHFVVGQGAFTVFVVVLFNLIEPSGWRVGLVRLQDIVIGTAVSLVVGVLLWPRGARVELRRSSAAAYERGCQYVIGGFALLFGSASSDAFTAAREPTADAVTRSAEAAAQYLGDPGSTRLPNHTIGATLGGARHLLAAGDALGNGAARYGTDRAAPGPVHLAAAGAQAAGRFAAFSDALRRGSRPGDRHSVDPEAATRDVLVALESWRGAEDERARATALRLVWGRDWARYLERLADQLREPVGDVAVSAARRWWQ